MAAELGRLLLGYARRATTGTLGEYMGAAVSGLIDGFLINGNHGGLWVVKNALGALLPAVIGGDFVKGFGIHSAGNTALIIMLMLAKRMGK